TIVAWTWEFGDGSPEKTTANASHTYTTPGEYTATLTVTDDHGATDTATVVVTVIANQAPTAVINASPQEGPRALPVQFDGTASVDPEGDPLTYAWDFGDGSNGSGPTPMHTYTTAGEYTATLVVADDRGKSSAPVSIGITVYVDDDRDGWSPPEDCDDSDPSVHPTALDQLDANGKDTTCAGVDGERVGTVFL